MPARFIEPKDLPPFDENACCEKCGLSRVGVVYHSHYVKNFPCNSDWGGVLGEHLCRPCPRCGYGWCEAIVGNTEEDS